MSNHKTPPSLAIVVLNYNGLSLLKQYLPTLLQYSDGYKVILVDNASTDGSVAYVQRQFPEVSCIVHNTNYGVAKGYNLALKQIHTTYYLLLNNDVLVTAYWLQDMLSLMQQNKGIALCQPKILSMQNPDYFDYAGAAGGFIDKDGYPFCRGRIFNSIEKDRGQYNDTRTIFWASGACLLVRAQAFHTLGGFDELFFAHFEEIDLCLRAHAMGWKVYYCGTSTVYHCGGATLTYTNPKKTYLNFRNRALMLYKHKHMIGVPKRLFLDFIAMFSIFFMGKTKDAWAICKAQIDFFKMKKNYQAQHHACSLPNVYTKSILVDFFVKRKKLFCELSSNAFTYLVMV
ncbi:glycosyltransferase family 2 protein [Cardinium endosymbiont of Culicoides punctatus]|uniref:glycosyltransferase family 2 protein n=1 Tax=Cardinium endosymbiont of Culicoides punctatus TaxID=2304601 RepID=UPI0010587EB9|nr:glycosyltransferase family 2 protein [Cardinium endosymbiont of Culicoides punctatus]TDG95495.1 N-acetylglucosaminyl-diphospho-decaprenol L-rhamnosyltransferase [Cardinium endosymbiont of Culicoides punctatus]